jgi:hypothetical protein
MSLDRIQALEGLGFEWNPSGRGKGTRNKPSLDDDTRCAIGSRRSRGKVEALN